MIDYRDIIKTIMDCDKTYYIYRGGRGLGRTFIMENYSKKKFRLGHNYDVTDYCKKDGCGKECYEKYYICSDVWDFHVCRILVGYNSEYEEEPRTKLLEVGDIDKRTVLEAVEEDLDMGIVCGDIRNFPDILISADYEDMGFKSIIKAVVDLDCGYNDDLKEYRYDTPIEDIISDVDSGYGITVLDADLNEVKE